MAANLVYFRLVAKHGTKDWKTCESKDMAISITCNFVSYICGRFPCFLQYCIHKWICYSVICTLAHLITCLSRGFMCNYCMQLFI